MHNIIASLLAYVVKYILLNIFPWTTTNDHEIPSYVLASQQRGLYSIVIYVARMYSC